MKYIKPMIFLAIICMVGISVNAAQVTNIELTQENGYTVAAIDVEGVVRFTHQAEEAKDGKPFRIIVDVLSATHDLGSKVFPSLPVCTVEKIRSSQYSVMPEQVVRVVFDMKSETVYSIDVSGNRIKLSIPDKNSPRFEKWSSKTYLAGISKDNNIKPTLVVAEKVGLSQEKNISDVNKSIEKDRQTSLQSTQKVEAENSKNKVIVQKSNELCGPEFDKEKMAASAQQNETKQPVTTTDSKQVVVNQPKPDNKQVAVAQPKPAEIKRTTQSAFDEKFTSANTTLAATVKSTDKEPAKQTTPPVKENPVVVQKTETSEQAPVSKTSPAKEVTKQVKPVVASKVETTSETKKPAAKEQKTESTKAVMTAATTDSKINKDDQSTSRFRRTSASRKIQGTMVAEFPKRLVIKYKSGLDRDPFETLINDTKINNSVVHQRLPNVEGLRLVGVIESADNNNRALFEDTDGYGYILKSGDKVKKGYVLRVENNKVYFQIFEYGWSRTVALNLEE